MKNKKIVSTLLAVIMLCTICFTAMGAAVPANDISTRAAGFTDVPADAWYAEAVSWCRENGIMAGTSSTRFSPNMDTQRGMLATVLYRAEGSPQVEPSSFTDVPAGQYYSDAVAWAEDSNIISGYGNRRFGPTDPITREQLVTILWRYEGSPRVSAADFADENRISTYASAAVDWARTNSIVSGVGGNRFNPTGHASRAQVAMVLYSNRAR